MSIYVWTSEIKNIYVWTTPVKEVYVWTTKVRPTIPSWEDLRPNVVTLYSSANWTIKHWYNSNYWEIKIEKIDWTFIIIADRDIWASSYSQYWKYFQWWNNYWFTMYPSKKSSSQVNAANYWPTNPYSSDTWISDTIWDSSSNNNLWWDTTDTELARKWPCLDWYHIPKYTEWNSLRTLMNSIVWRNNRSDYFNYLLLIKYDSGIYWRWDTYVWEWTAYWTSSSMTGDNAWKFELNYNPRNDSSLRATWYPIRPFKNTL